MAFSFSTSYLLSLALMGMVGLAWGSVDALLPTVLQQNVGDMDRGAAVGIWNLSRGFGPLGQLEIGALATIIGVAATQALNGLIFAVTVSIVMLAYRRRANHRAPANLASQHIGGKSMVPPVASTDYTGNTAADGTGSDITSDRTAK